MSFVDAAQLVFRDLLSDHVEEDDEPIPQRPRTRGECMDGPRPCPWVSCRHHLLTDVNEKTGSLRLNITTPGGREPKTVSLRVSKVNADAWIDRAVDHLDRMEETCSLDLGDERCARSLREVGMYLGVTRERARQIEASAIDKGKGNEDEHLHPINGKSRNY